jgi:hypothetical protein
MANAVATAATDDKVIDPEAPATRKAYDIKMKHVIVQTIDTLILSGKSHHTACAYAALFLFTTVTGRGCLQRLMMSMPWKSLWPTAQTAQLIKFIEGVQVF